MFKRYLKFLVADICDKAFGELNMTEQELADAAKLHLSTVYKLRTGRTFDPRFQTIFKLLMATGFDIKQFAKEIKELQDA